MKRKILLLLSFMLLCCSIQAQLSMKVHVAEPGSLATELGADINKVRDLTLTGTINAVDFQTMKTIPTLYNLDMKDVGIVDNMIPREAFKSRRFGELVLPSTITTIGNLAFWDARFSKPFVLPASVTYIGAESFVVTQAPSIDLTQCVDLASIGEKCFHGIVLESGEIDLSKNVNIKRTGTSLFQSTSHKIILPTNMLSIPAGFLMNCRGPIVFPEGVHTIGNNCFQGYTPLSGELVLPSTITTIGNLAFWDARFSKPFVLPASVTHLGKESFVVTQAPSIDLTQCVDLASIGEKCFHGIVLESGEIDLSKNVNIKRTGTSLFQSTSHKIILPTNMLSIPAGFLMNCRGPIVFPEGVHTIGNNCFQGYTPLSGELVLPSTITTIGNLAFWDARFSKPFVLPASVTHLGKESFVVTQAPSIDLTQCVDLASIGEKCFHGIVLESGEIDLSKNVNIKRTGTSLFQSTSHKIILPTNMLSIPAGFLMNCRGPIVFPEGVHTIGNNCFQGYTPLSGELVLPSTITTIGNLAFWDARFSKPFVLPASVTHLGKESFVITQTPSIDLTQCVDLANIGENCFHGIVLESGEIDLSKNVNIKRTGTSLFQSTSHKIILPTNMLSIPAGFLMNCRGPIVFPEGVHTIGNNCFQGYTPLSGELVLPSTITTIGNLAFWDARFSKPFVLPASVTHLGKESFVITQTPSIDLTQCVDLANIGENCFHGIVLESGEIDLSKNVNIKRTGTSLFQSTSHKIILPTNMLSIPAGFLMNCRGPIVFPEGVHTIGNNCFQGYAPRSGELVLPSTITTIGNLAFWDARFSKPFVLPASVTYIGNRAFTRTQMPELTSLNPIPPRLASEAFYLIHQSTIPLNVKDNNAKRRYKKAAQWKEFLNIIPIDPSDVALKYTHDNETFYPYNAVRVGEYLWIDNNFNHRAPSHQTGTGVENSFPMTQARFDKYLPKANLRASDYQIDINDFEKYYGIYYSRASMEYMQEHGKVYEKESNTPNSDWGLPTYNDYRQLFAMSPFTTGDVCLNQLDVQRALGAQVGDNPLAFDLKSDKGTQYDINWFKTSNNFYGFNLMPGGAILYRNDYWSNNTGSHAGLKGDVYHLFQAAGFMTQQSYSYIYDNIDTYNNYSEQWFNARWCRKLTDEELGYRLYINANKTDIIELGLDDEAPSGYAELPNGYLRGFYVQHMLGNPEPKYTVEDLVKFTTCINDRTPQTEPTRMAFKDPFQKEASEVKFYPNPVENILNVESKEPVKTMQLYSLSTGNLVFQTSNVDGSVSLGHIPAGVYVVKFLTPSGVQSYKLIKK